MPILLTLSPCSSAGPFQGCSPLGKLLFIGSPPWNMVPLGNVPLLQHGVLHGLQCGYILCPGTPPHHSLLALAFSLFLPFCSLSSLPGLFFALKYIFTEIPCMWWMGSAMSCGGSVLEPVWHRTALGHLPHMPLLQPLTTNTLTPTPCTRF